MRKRFAAVLPMFLLLLLAACTPNTRPVIVVENNLEVEVFDTDFDILKHITIDDDKDEITPTLEMIDFGDFDIDKVGTYPIIVTVEDSDGLRTSDSFLLTVVDTVSPVITIQGDTEVSISAGEPYTDLGASCEDNYDTICAVEITGDEVDTTKVGIYDVVFVSQDDAGNNAEPITRKVTVYDEEKPTLLLEGDGVIVVEVGDGYTDPGVTCIDNSTLCEVTVETDFNITEIGTWTFTYTATDNAGNVSEPVSRTVNIVDTVSPVLTTNDMSEVTFSHGDEFINEYITCSDNYDVTCEITIDFGILNLNSLGTYEIYYSATDASGNVSEVFTQFVTIIDDTPPTIALLGPARIYVDQFTEFLDLGVYCIDNVDEHCNVMYDTTELDMMVEGTYNVYVKAMDAHHNESVSITRTVVVQAPTDKEMALLGDEVEYILTNTEFTDSGIEFLNSGDFTVLTAGEVLSDTPGTYTIDYEITDELGYVTLLQRTVIVVDELPDQQEKLSLLNRYNLQFDYFVELSKYDTNSDLLLNTQENEGVLALNLADTGYSNIEELMLFSNLEVLNLNNNDLAAVDICDLSGNLMLKELHLASTKVFNVNCLNLLTNLDVLDVSDTYVYSINGLRFIDIKEINISNTNFSNISYFDNFTSLEFLNMENTNIKDIAPLTELPIQTLILNDQVENLLLLSDMTQLQYISAMTVDADLEESFLFNYLQENGVTVILNSMTDFDVENPNIIVDEQDVQITVGETFILDDIEIYAYDQEDGYIYDSFIFPNIDTTLLEVGEYQYNITVTDSDNNQSSITIYLSVLGDYDLANLVVFIKFADEENYISPYDYEYMYDLFNGDETSVRDYFRTVSDDEYNINSVFYGHDIVFYTAPEDRSYYQPYDELTNPNGYENYNQSYYREQDLLLDAIDWIETEGYIPDHVNLDQNNDDVIDNITFLVSGQVDDWSDLLWPHKYALYENLDGFSEFTETSSSINGKYAYEFTLQLLGVQGAPSEYFTLGVLAHEMFHIIGAPDLYHYYQDDSVSNIGHWGLMDSVTDIPSHMLLYMKEAYGGWLQDTIEVTESGSYTINQSLSDTDNLLVIDLGYSNEYLYLEYRTDGDEYEMNLPNEGLIIYRVDTDHYDNGNVYGFYNNNDVAVNEVFLFRPISYDETVYTVEDKIYITNFNVPDLSFLTLDGITTTGTDSGIYLFHSDGTVINIQITVTAQTPDHITVQIDFN